MTSLEDTTAALRDLLGPDVRKYVDLAMWRWGGFRIHDNGDISSRDSDGIHYVHAATLDLLHAASQIVRRMNHA